MNLNKMFVFLFVFLGFSAILLQYMPHQFLNMGVEASYQDKEARDYFNEQDVTMYNYTLSLNLTFPETKQYDFGLPEGQKLEFWWGNLWYGYGSVPVFQLKHLTDNFWGWWWGSHYLVVQEPYASKVAYPNVGLDKASVLALFDEDYNAGYCEFACDHLNVKLFILTYNQSWTLEESWDNGKLKLYTSYDIDWTATGTSMWHVMMQLLSFQNPNLGIPGIGGTILSHGVALALWACIALLAFAFITSVIPFIRGWVGGGG